MKKHVLLSLLTLCMGVVALAQPAGWKYSKPFAVTNSGAQLITNYTLAVTVNTQALISASKMKANGADIRFGTPCTGTKNFNYFIDSGINTAATLIYVQVDSLKANATETIYMFYGNDTASAKSSYNALQGPYTMFSGNTSSFTSYFYDTYYNTGLYDQAGTYFQPNQQLIVTAIGVYSPSSTTKKMNLSLMTGTPSIIATKQLSPTSGSWSFVNLDTPVILSSANPYSVTEVFNDANYDYGYYGIPSSISPQVNVLGYTYDYIQTSNTLPPANAYSSSYVYGVMDIRYYLGPAANPNVTILADTAINAAAFYDPASKLVCPGSTVTFTALAGGLAPTYQWQVKTGNSWVNVNTGSLYSGVNLPTLTVSGTTAAMNGYKYRAYMTSTCGTGYSQPATLSINISAPVTPVASITGPNPACQYTNAIYTLTTNVQGATYTFYRNSTAAVTGVNGNQYAFAPGSADTVYAVVTTPNNAALACYTVPVAVTNSIRIMVGSNFTPTDSIAASSNNGCQGSIVDFTGYGNVVGGTYQWYVNNTAVAGATASTYSYAPNNGDQVTERINTPANGCYSLTNVVSNPVVATTTYSITPSIQVVGPATAQAGQQVTFTANITNFCASYTIYWYNDYMLIDSTINTNTLNFKKGTQGNDFISAVIVPQSPCAGTCYQSSKQSNLLTLTFTEPNVGVGNVAANSGISMYPNPFTSKITVNGLKTGDKLMVYDMTGRTMSAEYQAAGTTGEYLLQTLAPGHYILRVTDSEGNVKANLPMSKL